MAKQLLMTGNHESRWQQSVRPQEEKHYWHPRCWYYQEQYSFHASRQSKMYIWVISISQFLYSTSLLWEKLSNFLTCFCANFPFLFSFFLRTLFKLSKSNLSFLFINSRTFFDCVEKVVEGHGLDENEILDVEQSRWICHEYLKEYLNIPNRSEWAEATWPPSEACGARVTRGPTSRHTSWSWTRMGRGGGASWRSRRGGLPPFSTRSCRAICFN